MGFDYLRHDLEKLTHDDNQKIATLAEGILRLMEESED